MAQYLVSARKYRPDSFETLIGQDNIARTLKNSILRGQLAHAYLFCGPRGVGKTSAARIFARTINCSNPGPDMEPCGECESCVSFKEGRSYCIHELDAASNNGVEDIKALMEQAQDLRVRLLDCVNKDAEAFEPLSKAYGIPKDDPTRDEVLENATLEACKVPVRIMELCCDAVSTIGTFAEKGSKLAVSDAACGAVCLKAALEAASLNVYINTKSLKNRQIAAEINEKCEKMLSTYGPVCDEVYTKVRNSFLDAMK